jgi:hypothetical protein
LLGGQFYFLSIPPVATPAKNSNKFDSMEKQLDQLMNADTSDRATEDQFKFLQTYIPLLSSETGGSKYLNLVKQTYAQYTSSDSNTHVESINKLKSDIQKNNVEFNNLAKSNGWKNLIRISDRLMSRDSAVLTEKSFSFQIGLSVKDCEALIQVIQTSTLGDELKTNLSATVANLSALNKSLLDSLQQHYRQGNVLQVAVYNLKKHWETVRAKYYSEHSTTYSPKPFYYYLNGALFLGVLIFMGVTLRREMLQRGQHLQGIEKNVLHIIDQMILKQEPIDLSDYTESFKSALIYMQGYAQKRMSYGHMFQETLPFPAVMLDENLQVRWFNKHLTQQWNLDTMISQRDSLTWEHLSSLSNMNTVEPLLDALHQGHSGIYQLQIKPFNGSDSLPYQMYVSPYELGQDKYCLLFFYPLLTLEETIEMQTKSITNPVTRTLQALVSDRYDVDFEFNSSKEYEIGGIKELHQLFSELYSKYTTRNESLLNELNKSERLVQEYAGTVHDVNMTKDSIKVASKDVQKNFTLLKKVVMLLMEKSTSYDESIQKQLMNSLHLLNRFEQLFKDQTTVSGELHRFMSTAQALPSLKVSNKEVKEQLILTKGMVNRALKTITGTGSKELEKIPESLVQMEKYLHQLDMALNKISFSFEELIKVKEKTSVVHQSDYAQMQQLMSDGEKNITMMMISMQQDRAKFIEVIGDLYQAIQSESKSLHTLDVELATQVQVSAPDLLHVKQ